jgi:DHA3 family macrolide efflux protein-like MFS transporter
MVQILSGSAMPLGILIFGPLADRVSIQLLLVISGTLLAAVGLIYGRTASKQQVVKKSKVPIQGQ